MFKVDVETTQDCWSGDSANRDVTWFDIAVLMPPLLIKGYMYHDWIGKIKGVARIFQHVGPERNGRFLNPNIIGMSFHPLSEI